MQLARDRALNLAISLLAERNASQENAFLQADVLVEAELKGHPSHGLQRLPRILSRIERGLIDPRARGDAHWRADATLEVDGRTGLGPPVTIEALRQLKQRVPASGIALAAIRNSNHIGMLAYYVEHIALWGCLGVAMSSSEALVHPYGGTRAMLGTNPIAVAIPTAGRPLVLDLATSAVSMGKIHHYAETGRPLLEGWARDADGRPTRSATHAKSGAIAPFGGAKGYGLGMAIELLVATLARSALAPDIRGTLDDEFVCNKGDIMIAIDPGSVPDLMTSLSGYLDLVRDSPSAQAGAPVSIPGDGAALRRTKAIEEGFEIEPRLWAELNDLSRSQSSVAKGYA